MAALAASPGRNSVLDTMKRHWNHDGTDTQPLGLSSSYVAAIRSQKKVITSLQDVNFDDELLLGSEYGSPSYSRANLAWAEATSPSLSASRRSLNSPTAEIRLPSGALSSGRLSPRTAPLSPSPPSPRSPVSPGAESMRSAMSRSLASLRAAEQQEPRSPWGNSSPWSNPSSSLRVVMPRPVEGRKLGLAVKDLIVVGIMNNEAQAYGWRVGDRITGLNGAKVYTQADFTAELNKAMDAYYGHSLSFDVVRDKGGRPYPSNEPDSPGRYHPSGESWAEVENKRKVGGTACW